MRYAPTQKGITRLKILEVASRTFRERGVEATGVDEVMRRAGLTHGGFYAHFKTKEELVSEACLAGFESAVINLERIAALPTPKARLRSIVASYLGPRHRDNPSSGCLLVALGAEVARLPAGIQEAYAKGLERHRERFAEALRLSPRPEENSRLVTSLLSLLAGALLFARSLHEREASDRVLADARRTALDFFGRDLT